MMVLGGNSGIFPGVTKCFGAWGTFSKNEGPVALLIVEMSLAILCSVRIVSLVPLFVSFFFERHPMRARCQLFLGRSFLEAATGACKSECN